MHLHNKCTTIAKRVKLQLFTECAVAKDSLY